LLGLSHTHPELVRMYVCICHAFTQRQVRSALDQGARTTAAVYRQIGARIQCGKCVPMVRDMVREHGGSGGCGGGGNCGRCTTGHAHSQEHAQDHAQDHHEAAEAAEPMYGVAAE
jgi:bacterioferritin-associated ferredoxin